MTSNQTQTVQNIIGTHERLEQWACETVQFLADINDEYIADNGHPSDEINTLTDRYFALQER